MIRRSSIVFALLLFLIEPVRAQVASPTLLPVVVTGNPAVIQWARGGVLAAGYLQGESEERDTSTTPDTVSSGDSSGPLAGLRITGDPVSFGILGITIKGDNDAGVSLSADSVSGALALQLGDALALGVLSEQGGFKLESNNVPVLGQVILEVDSSLVMGGVSLRMADLFYLGLAAGPEKQQQKVTVPAFPALDVEGEVTRDVRRYGAGLYDDEGVQWHLEYNVSFSEFNLDEATGAKAKELEERTLVLELQMGPVLLGYSVTNTTETDEAPAPDPQREEESRGITLGWVPSEGFALILIAENTEGDDGVVFTEGNSLALFIGYLF